MKREKKITGYIWYNPDMGIYQKGKKEEYNHFFEMSGKKEGFSLILELTNHSDILAYKLVKELNLAKETHIRSQMRPAV